MLVRGDLVLFEGDVVVIVSEGFVYELVVEANELSLGFLLLLEDGLAHGVEVLFGVGGRGARAFGRGCGHWDEERKRVS